MNPLADSPSPDASPSKSPAPLEPMDPAVGSIQPGGGWCMRMELAWGGVRRTLLRTFCRRYVERMRACRRGEPRGVPYDVLDPRDLKFYRNQNDCGWDPADDRFAWRDRLPFARVGLAELLILGGGFFVLAAVLSWWYWPAAPIPVVLGLFVGWFFRNPRRLIPEGSGIVVSPADGKVVTVAEVDHDEFIGGPAVVVGIFLSVFNVHINRSPIAARVVGLTYRRGKFLNALYAASVDENEQMHVRIEETGPPYRRMVVKQIAGAIARRIVCWIKPGDALERGGQFGMIKLGSRTELLLPREPGLVVAVKVGQHVRAGASVVARYATGDRLDGGK